MDHSLGKNWLGRDLRLAQSDGKPIQPLYTGHATTWADYSHGVRLIANDAELNGKKVRLADIFRDGRLSWLASDEGHRLQLALPTNWPPPLAAKAAKPATNSTALIFKPGATLKLVSNPP